MTQDAWVASLSSGDTVVEHWTQDELSPWNKLMQYCKDKDLYLTNLRLTVCSKTISLKPHAIGYWQMHQCSFLQGGGDIPISRGIGFVDGHKIKIVWGVRTFINKPHFWSEERSIDGQSCIIWSPKRNVISI
jgi:hypothetical protein